MAHYLPTDEPPKELKIEASYCDFDALNNLIDETLDRYAGDADVVKVCEPNLQEAP